MAKIVGSPFGALLRQYRRAANLTQEGLAERARISARSISDLERGLSRMPHPDTILALAQALSLSGTQHTEFLAAARSHPHASVLPMELPPLPVMFSPLVGREREEAALLHLLQRDASRFLTLTGPVGVGKTRLAFQVAHTAQKYFADGVVFIFLEAIREPRLVLSAIAQTLKLQEKRQKDVFQILVTTLRDRHLLLVLDNCEQVLEAAEPLLELLTACPLLTMLTTSRARWRVRGEQTFPLAPLPVPSLPFSGPPEQCAQYGALSLFLQCVRAIQPDFHLMPAQVPIVAELCARLDGLPLALELAASRFPLFSPLQFLERMGRKTGPGVLQMVAGHLSNGPKRHQSLRVAIDWSYELLDEAEQRLFRSLCIFEGSISLEAMQAVCLQDGEEENALLERLETLLAQNLVHRIIQDETRLRVLETVRAYGLERLAAAGEERKLRAAYASFILALVKREARRLTGAEHLQALTQLSKERDHLHAVLRWLQDQHELEQSLQLAGELWRYWFLQGALSEGRNWFDRLLAQEEQEHKVQALTLARACYGSGVLAAEQGDYECALALGKRCSQVAEQFGEDLLQAQALNLQGNIAKYQGTFALAAQCFERSLALFRLLQQETNVAVCLNNLATLAQERGDYSQARQLQEESLAIKRSQGNQRGIAVALMNLGDIARDEGQLADAHRWAEESLRLFQALSDEKGCALALNNLGEVACLQGDYELADTCIQDSLKLSREMGDHWAMAVAFHSAARVAWARREKEKAQRYYLQSLQIYMEEQSQSGMVECLEGLLMLFFSSEPHLSAQLVGLTSRWRTRTETPLPPVDAPNFEQARVALWAILGEERFTQLFSDGQAASLVEKAFALSDKFSSLETTDPF